MKIYTLKECREFLKEQKYKHVSLQNSDGQDVVKFNTSKITPEERINQMETRLKSPTLPDGYYVFLGKYNMQKDSVPDKFYIVKGNPKELDKEPALIPEQTKPEPNALSYEAAIKMNKKIADLNSELSTVTRERDEYRDKYNSLMDEVEDIMNEEPDEEEELSENPSLDNIGKWLESFAANLTPIFDRHYDLKEKELDIEEGKVIAKLTKAGFKLPAQQNGEPVQEQQQIEQETEIPDLSEGELAQMTEEEQTQYNLLKLAQLAQTDPERYREVVAQMNAGEYAEDEPEDNLEP